MFMSNEDSVTHRLAKTVIKLPKQDDDWELPNQLQQFFQINSNSAQIDPPSEPVLNKVNSFVLRLFGQSK